jgi:hypothetical protein
MRSRIFATLLFLLTLPAGRTVAQQLPPPTPLPLEPSSPLVVYIPQSRSAYEHWQYRSVNRFGQQSTRIIYTPYGAFRAVDGAPYPWLETDPRYWKPTAPPTNSK